VSHKEPRLSPSAKAGTGLRVLLFSLRAPPRSLTLILRVRAFAGETAAGDDDDMSDGDGSSDDGSGSDFSGSDDCYFDEQFAGEAEAVAPEDAIFICCDPTELLAALERDGAMRSAHGFAPLADSRFASCSRAGAAPRREGGAGPL